MAMKPDTVSLREIIIKKRYDKERWGDPERFSTLWELIYGGFNWGETPEGWRFWRSLRISVSKRSPKAEDVVLQNKSWR